MRGFLHKRRRKKHRGDEEMALQITSLADVLIIVLVFLLKSVSASLEEVQNVSVPSNLKLPIVQDGGAGKDGMKIEISESLVQIDGKTVAELSNYRFKSSDLNNDLESGGTSKSLSKAISTEKKAKRDLSSVVWVVADHRAPYKTIQTVLASAALNGLTEIKLAVLREE